MGRNAWSLRQKVLTGTLLTILLALLVSFALLLLQARQRITAERTASAELADMLVVDRLKTQLRSEEPIDFADFLSHLPPLRHVRIFLLPQQEAAWQRFHDADPLAHPTVPAWFMRILRPLPWERWHPMGEAQVGSGHVVVIADPDDEIAEVWDDLLYLGKILLWLVAAQLGLTLWSMSQTMHPLQHVRAGLAALRQGQRDTILAPFSVAELEPLRCDFNALAAALRQSHAENHHLIARLMSIQEEERLSLAREFHDELGPNLFGIKAQASCILRSDSLGKSQAHARTIINLTQDLQALTRRMLRRLRPMALDDLGLIAALTHLVEDWRQRAPDITWTMTVTEWPATLPKDRMALELYRVIQEGLTNAARHSHAQHVDLCLQRLNDPAPCLQVILADDGQGLTESAPLGFGVMGMKERIASLQGTWCLQSQAGQGTHILITIPLPPGQNESKNEQKDPCPD